MAPTKRSPAGPPHSPHCYHCTNLSDFFTSDISPSHCFPMSLLCLQAVHPFSCTAPSPFGFSARMAFPSRNITLHLPPLLPPSITVSTLLPPGSHSIPCVCCIEHNLLDFSFKTYHGIALLYLSFSFICGLYNQFPSSFFKLSPLCSSNLSFIGACRKVDTNSVIPLTLTHLSPYFHVSLALVLSGVQLYHSVLTRV